MDLRLVRLPIRQQRRILTGLSGALAMSLLAVVLLWALPLDLPRTDPGAVMQPATAPSAQAPGPLEGYAIIWQRDLQQPLFDIKPPVTAPAAPALRVQLLGTAIDPGFTYGIFQTAAGESKLLSIGQSIEGATIVAITADSAVLRRDQQEFHLNVVRKENP